MKQGVASRRQPAKVLAGVFVVASSRSHRSPRGDGRQRRQDDQVAIVANPQMQDIASLTPSLFTPRPGSSQVPILDEGKLRQVTTRDVGSGGKAFDAVMIGMYETRSSAPRGCSRI